MKKERSSKESEELFHLLRTRFKKNMNRHEGLVRSDIEGKLTKNKGKIWSLGEMEDTGGEPNAVDFDEKNWWVYIL